MVRPFGAAPLLEQACPMGEIFKELQGQLNRLKMFEEEAMDGMAPS
jgi:adenylate cyclase